MLPPSATADAAPVTVDRREGPFGEVVLRRRGRHFEIIANGCFLMDTSDGRSERLLIRAALDALPGTMRAPSALIGGLGVGFSLAEAAAWPGTAAPSGAREPGASAGEGSGGPAPVSGSTPAPGAAERTIRPGRVGRITVVEREEAVVDWHRAGYLAPFSAGALDDPRTVVVRADLPAHLSSSSETYDALCLDIDNGPDWTVTEGNADLYGPAGLAACRDRLNPGGVLAVWSARPSSAFDDRLREAGFSGVRSLPVPVLRGEPDVVHLAVRG